MLQSPTNVTIRANNGQGNVEIHGKTKITQAEIGILVSPVISNIQTQIADIQKKISSSSNTSSNTSNNNNIPTPTPSPLHDIQRDQNQYQIINARLNTLQDQIKSIEERLNSFVISVDERFSLINNTSSNTSTSSNTVPINTNSEETQPTLIVLKRTPSSVNNKILRYAW